MQPWRFQRNQKAYGFHAGSRQQRAVQAAVMPWQIWLQKIFSEQNKPNSKIRISQKKLAGQQIVVKDFTDAAVVKENTDAEWKYEVTF